MWKGTCVACNVPMFNFQHPGGGWVGGGEVGRSVRPLKVSSEIAFFRQNFVIASILCGPLCPCCWGLEITTIHTHRSYTRGPTQASRAGGLRPELSKEPKWCLQMSKRGQTLFLWDLLGLLFCLNTSTAPSKESLC